MTHGSKTLLLNVNLRRRRDQRTHSAQYHRNSQKKVQAEEYFGFRQVPF